MEPSVFGIGSVVVDHVVELGRYPEPDTKNAIKAHWQQVGGPVPVALCTAAFYGTRTTLLSRWGDDPAGRFIRETLHRRGVRIDSTRSQPGWSSGFAQVWTETATGRRTIAYTRGSFPPLTAAELDDQGLRQHSLLHLDGWCGEAAVRAAHNMRASGGRVVLDAGSRKTGMETLLPLVDILVASALFRRGWFGTDEVSSQELLRLGPPLVIATDGPHGATVLTQDQRVHQPAWEVDAVDTNGAGDVFCGALLSRLANDAPILEAVRFASIVAGYACQARGNQHLPDLATVTQTLERLPTPQSE